MKFPDSRHFHRSPLLLLVLAFFGLVLVPQAHATGITFKSFCHANTASGSTINCTLAGIATADTIIVSIFGVGVFNGFVASDSQSNIYTEQIFSLTGNAGGASSYIYATLSTALSGSIVVTVTTGAGSPTRVYGFTASDYNGVTGFGKTGTDQQDAPGNSGTSTVTLSGTGSTSAFIDDLYIVGLPGTASVTPNNAQTIRDSGFQNNCAFTGFCEAADTTSPILGWSWSGGNVCQTPPACFVSHSVLELTGLPSGPTNTVFQCYGNCGNPPITLVNTNSTHTTNFNQSITIFYEFQSNINGFLLNVTTSLAKSYTSTNNGPSFGIYTIPSCALGTTPFTPACPGLLQSSIAFFSPAKGKISMANLRIPVFAGQWVAIALSAAAAGLDVNDTNTNLGLFQTNEGKIPPSIQQPGSLGNSKMGLWAWITGNVIVTTTPPPTAGFNCAGFLDCILPNWVSSFCALGNPSCLGVSGLVWAGILGVVFTFIVVKFGTELIPAYRMPIGEIFMFFFLMWLFTMSGLGLTFIWIPIFFFFIISILMRKNVGSFL